MKKLHHYLNNNNSSICEHVTSPGKGYAFSMWQVALREALKAERRARYRAFLSPISCWPRGMAPGPALLKELAALTLSSKLDKWNVIQLWRRPKEAGRHTQHWRPHTTRTDRDKSDTNGGQMYYNTKLQKNVFRNWSIYAVCVANKKLWLHD